MRPLFGTKLLGNKFTTYNLCLKGMSTNNRPQEMIPTLGTTNVFEIGFDVMITERRLWLPRYAYNNCGINSDFADDLKPCYFLLFYILPFDQRSN